VDARDKPGHDEHFAKSIWLIAGVVAIQNSSDATAATLEGEAY
jgi:hypothetical protein